MQWRPIDDNIEIDTYLISCAEYQLFIDSQLQLNQKCHPFHWINHRFPPGNSKNPVTGVRAKDAEAFCQWLNQHPLGNGFHYRLPTLSESQKYPGIEVQIGYWCKSDENLTISGVSPDLWPLWRRNLTEVLDRSCVIDCIWALVLAFNYISDIDINITLILERALTSARNLELTGSIVRSHALAHALARSKDLAADLAKSLIRILDKTRQKAEEIRKNIILDREFLLEITQELALEIEREMVFEKDLCQDLQLIKKINITNKSRELTYDLNLAFYLANNRNLAIARTKDFTRLLAKDLPRSLTRSLERLCNIDLVLSYTIDLDFDTIDELDAELEYALELALELNSTRVREIYKILNCARYLNGNSDFQSFRYYLLLISICWQWLSSIYKKYSGKSLLSKQPKEDNHQYLSQKYAKKVEKILNLYASYVLIEERQKGEIPAWEGIRLVRERNTDW